MLGKLQTYKLQPTKFYEKGHGRNTVGTLCVFLSMQHCTWTYFTGLSACEFLNPNCIQCLFKSPIILHYFRSYRECTGALSEYRLSEKNSARLGTTHTAPVRQNRTSFALELVKKIFGSITKCSYTSCQMEIVRSSKC